MVERDLITQDELAMAYQTMKPQLLRHPAIDPEAFERRVRAWLAELDSFLSALEGRVHRGP